MTNKEGKSLLIADATKKKIEDEEFQKCLTSVKEYQLCNVNVRIYNR